MNSSPGPVREVGRLRREYFEIGEPAGRGWRDVSGNAVIAYGAETGNGMGRRPTCRPPGKRDV